MSSNGTVLSITAPRLEWESVVAEKESLPKTQRDLVTREVRGEQKPMDETDELIVASLNALQDELRDSSSPAYRRAVESCTDYVRSDDFCLMFLRADKFKAKEAARRMEKYWELRLRLFGEPVAFEPRSIRCTDLSGEDLATMHNHGLQLLPQKDKAGRALILLTRRKFSFQNHANIGRLVWYLMHAALEDAGVQRNGVVIVAYDDGPFELKNFDRKLDKHTIGLLRTLPLRIIAAHHFFDSKVLELITPFLLFLMGGELRMRYKQYAIRSSTSAHVLEKLEEFGVLASMLPSWVKGGTLEFDSQQWLQERRRKEGEAQNT